VSSHSITSADLQPLHDAELNLILMDRAGRSLRLGFMGPDQIGYIFTFENIVTYKINNVQCQNVISRILISGLTSDLDKNIDKIVRWTCSGSANDLLITEDQLQQHVLTIRSSRLRLLYVDPSWGAEIGVMAEVMNLTHSN
jgi:hypothetical protein